MAEQYSKSKLEQIIRTYTKAYGALAKQLTETVLQELNKGQSLTSAVAAAFKRSDFHTGNAEAVAEAIYAAALVGLDLSPTIVAAATEKTIRENLTGRSWTGDGVKLSDRLHGVDGRIKSDILTTVSASMRNYDTVKVMAKNLYDGYHSGKAVISQAQLPEYMRKLRTMMLLAFQGDQRAVNESKIMEKIAAMNIKNLKTPLLKAAYSEVLAACNSQDTKVLEKALWVAAQEKSRYYAERIARTESSRAYYDGFMAKIAKDELVIGVMWLLNSSHPKFDICDMYAKADMFNMGKGIYPKNKVPKIPVHPHCLCHLLEVYEGEVEPEQIKDNTDKAVSDWLNGLTDRQRRDVLGVKGAEEFSKTGKWQGNLRGWQGFGVPESRLSVEQAKPFKISKKDLNNKMTVDRAAVNSQEYRAKFDSLPINKDLADSLHKESITILEKRDGTAFETMVALDFKTGKKIVSSSTDKEFVTSFNSVEITKFNAHKGKVVLLHNHPLGGRLSHTDLITAIKIDKVAGLMTVGHDGYMGYAEILKYDKDIAKKWEEWYNEAVKTIQHKGKASQLATDKLYKEGLIRYYENGRRI